MMTTLMLSAASGTSRVFAGHTIVMLAVPVVAFVADTADAPPLPPPQPEPARINNATSANQQNWICFIGLNPFIELSPLRCLPGR
jgi:hypothetical protein